jgi:hypothetical protein
MRIKLLTASRDKMKLLVNGGTKEKMCGDLQRAAHKHVEDLACKSKKREGGGVIIDLLIRAFFTRSL